MTTCEQAQAIRHRLTHCWHCDAELTGPRLTVKVFESAALAEHYCNPSCYAARQRAINEPVRQTCPRCYGTGQVTVLKSYPVGCGHCAGTGGITS